MYKNRKSIRLKHYDYSRSGLYFITICVNHGISLFGHINKNSMILNDAGKMIKKCYYELEGRFKTLKCHEMVIMPNHFHCIIEIVGAPLVGAQNSNNINNRHPQTKGQPQGIAPTVGDIIGAFKSIITNEYIYGVKHKNWQPFNKKLWQRNYWEHVIRDEESYLKLLEYIKNNPQKWELDSLNPNRKQQ